MKILQPWSEAVTYITKDGSSIRELLHPQHNRNRNQSLAEARVETGGVTQAHYHSLTEEIYYIIQGTGSMRIDAEWFDVEPGDSICILPGSVHQIRNTGDSELVFLCCCSPAYSHEDTTLVDQRAD